MPIETPPTTTPTDGQQPAAPVLDPGEQQPAVTEPAPNSSFAEEDAKLADLQRQVDEEAAAKAAAAPAAAPAAPAAAAGTQPAPAATGDTSGNNSTSAIIALRKNNRELRDAYMIEKGKNEALTALAKPGQQAEGEQQPAQENLTVDQQLDAIDTSYADIATRVDAGDLTDSEAEAERVALRRRERALVAAHAVEQVQQNNQQSPSNDLALEEHVTAVVTSYPVLNKITAKQLAPFEALAYQQAEDEGKPITATAAGTKDLRTRMAALAEQVYDPVAYTKRQAALAANGQGQGQGSQQSNAGARPAQPTVAQREAKLDMAATHPPDLSQVGSAAQAGELTLEAGEAIVNSLKGDDLQKWMAANPSFVRKVMGNSVRLN